MCSEIQISSRRMNLIDRTTTTCLVISLLICLCILASYADRRSIGWSGLYGWIIPLAGAIFIATLAIAALRATTMVWITVLVLLAFAGKRRRFLVTEGKKITADVAMYLAKVVLKERSLLAVACATIVGFFMAMASSF